MTTNGKLLCEHIRNIEVLCEATEQGKRLHIVGPFLQAGVVNANKRWYDPGVLAEAVDKYDAEKIRTGRSLGELGHPENPAVNLERVSHRIVELKRSGNDWIGKAVVLPEGAGKILSGLLDVGSKIGMSSRGIGHVEPDARLGCDRVMSGFELTAIDAVADPSAPSAFVEAVMENCRWVYDVRTDAWFKEHVAETRKALKKKSKRQLAEGAMKTFGQYVKATTTKPEPVVEEEVPDLWMRALLKFPSRFSPW